MVLIAGLHASPALGAELTLAGLMREFAAVPAAEGRFTEARQMSALQRPLLLSGRLAYVRPNRLERHVLSPYDERTVIEAGRVTVENRTRNTVRTFSLDSAPAAYALVESLRATLAGDLEALQRHYSIDLKGVREDWTLSLLPRDPAVASLITRVTVAGAQARVLRFDVEEVGGDRSTMTISDAST